MSNEYDPNISSSYLDGKIDKIKAKEFHPNKFKELWEIKRAIIYQNIINRDSNEAHYARFAEIAHTKEFFSIEDIKALNLPYDILIFLSEKNIGKSWNIITRSNEIISRGGKVVLMRALDEHLKMGLSEQLLGNHSCFYMGADFKLYHKETPNPATGRGRAHVGYAMALTTAIKWKGGSFDDVEHIFFDEATDEHKLIKTKEFRKFFISVANSIERRKKDITIEIFGNTDFNVSHPLFEVFEIDPEENLVYTTRKLPGADRPTRILYINSRGLYPRGAKDSKFIGAIGDPRAALDAFMNKVKNNTDRMTSIDLTYLTTPMYAIIFKEPLNQENITWQLLVSSYNHIEEATPENGMRRKITKWYYIKCEPFQPAYLYGYKIYTDDVVLYSLYRSFCHFIKDGTKLWIQIKRILSFGKCIMIRRDTEDMLSKVLERKSKNPNIIVG